MRKKLRRCWKVNMILNWLKQKYPRATCANKVVTREGIVLNRFIVSNYGLVSDISLSYARTKFDHSGIEVYATYSDYPDEDIPDIFKDKLVYYISYIQEKFQYITEQCERGNYYDRDLGIVIRLWVNPTEYKFKFMKPPTEVFLLIKWFIEIQDTHTVPEELEEYITKDMALEILEG